LEESGQEAGFFVDQHVTGNLAGIVDAGDWQLNDQALVDG